VREREARAMAAAWRRRREHPTFARAGGR